MKNKPETIFPFCKKPIALSCRLILVPGTFPLFKFRTKFHSHQRGTGLLLQLKTGLDVMHSVPPIKSLRFLVQHIGFKI
jgi:hypothetical protein